MDFTKLVVKMLNETNVAGGASSVFGSNVTQTAQTFSGDNYATGDARVPKSLYGGHLMTRYGLKKKKKTKKKS